MTSHWHSREAQETMLQRVEQCYLELPKDSQIRSYWWDVYEPLTKIRKAFTLLQTIELLGNIPTLIIFEYL